MKKGLGKGLDAIFEDNDLTPAPEPAGGIREIRVSEIEPNRAQPRKRFDEEALAALAASIEEHGLIQPLIVEPIEGERYRIIAGERRWRACRMAGKETAPAIVRTVTEQQNMELALIENLQREDLNPIEEARGYRTLADVHNMTQEEIAKSVGKSRPEISNRMRLLSLPEQIIDFISAGDLSAGHARALMGLEKTDDMLALANRVITEELSVRQTEALVARMKAPSRKSAPLSDDVRRALREMEKEASEHVGNKVTVRHTPKNRGKVEIEYYSVAELEKIIDVLKGGGDRG